MPNQRSKEIKTNNMIKPFMIWALVALIFGYFIVSIKSILLPFVLGMLVAYMLDPLADRLENRKFSRTMATIIITIPFFIILIFMIMGIVPLLYHQILAFINDIPSHIKVMEQFYANNIAPLHAELSGSEGYINNDLSKELLPKISGVIKNIAIGVVNSGGAFIHLISLLVITPVVTFYMLRDWDILTEKFEMLLPRKYADTVIEQLELIDKTLSGFIRGQLTVCALLGTFYAIALWLAGLKYAILIGMIAGCLIIIPYVGTIFSGIIAIGLAWLQFDGNLTDVGIVAAIFIFGQVVEGNILTPKIVGDKVGLHPLWLIFGMMAGGVLLGFVGILLSVPITAIIGVLTRFLINNYKESELYI